MFTFAKLKSAIFSVPLLFIAAQCASNAEGLGQEPEVLLQPHQLLTGHAQITTAVTSKVVQPDSLIEDLVSSSESSQPGASEILKKKKFFNTPMFKVMAQGSNLMQFCTAYRGFEPSSEAADAVLEEKVKIRSKAAADWAWQKQHDELHKAVVASTMQIAQGLGMTDELKRQAAVQTGVKELEGLVGKEKANETLSSMEAWSATVDRSTFAEAAPLDITKIQDRIDSATSDALKNDEVVQTIKASLSKYNHHSTTMLAAAKAINTTMSAVMFSPTVFSPAAQVTLMGFLAVTGGPEEAKLIKSLYFDRRLESRYKLLTYEITLSTNSYNTAVLSRNPILAAYCVNRVQRLGSKNAFNEGPSNNQLVSQPVAPNH